MSLAIAAPLTTPVEPATPVRPKTPRQALLDAARYIEEHGWVSGEARTAAGRVCLMSAIAAVSPDDDMLVFSAALLRVRRVVGRTPHRWNDEPGRTEAEVIAALRKAAQ